MQEYIFLFVLAFLWTLVASIQDLKKREVANWLNFSLLAFALAYRMAVTILTKNLEFFLFGLIGVAIFTVIAFSFYYANAFGGGDAKLLIAFGAIMPFSSYGSILPTTIIFILLLFTIGAIYTLAYTAIIAVKRKEKFRKHFKQKVRANKKTLIITISLAIISSIYATQTVIAIFVAILFLIPTLYIYTKAIESTLLIRTHYSKLTEGDWIKQDIKINSKLTIKKTVHGLSEEDIALLKKYNQSIEIQQGIPFVPPFLITLILMALVYAISKPAILSSFLQF